jgi:hypothetical protein
MMKEMNLHTYLAREQPENKCFTDSSILQNLQHLSPMPIPFDQVVFG